MESFELRTKRRMNQMEIQKNDTVNERSACLNIHVTEKGSGRDYSGSK